MIKEGQQVDVCISKEPKVVLRLSKWSFGAKIRAGLALFRGELVVQGPNIYCADGLRIKQGKQ